MAYNHSQTSLSPKVCSKKPLCLVTTEKVLGTFKEENIDIIQEYTRIKIDVCMCVYESVQNFWKNLLLIKSHDLAGKYLYVRCYVTQNRFLDFIFYFNFVCDFLMAVTEDLVFNLSIYYICITYVHFQSTYPIGNI